MIKKTKYGLIQNVISFQAFWKKNFLVDDMRVLQFLFLSFIISLVACGSGDSSTESSDHKSSDGDAVKICDSGEKISCSTLGGIWGGGTATCRSDETAYDVSECSRAGTSSRWVKETIYPAQRDDRWKNAKCNYEGDFLFELTIPPNPSGVWVIELQAGGFCGYDGTNDGGCTNRTLSLVSNKKTTTISFPDDRTVENEPDDNDPDFGRAIHAFAHYCSSDQWSGTNTDGVMMHYTEDGSSYKKWPFTGHINFDAMMDILHERYGLDDSDPNLQILFRGTSAGGWGVFNNTWDMYKRFPKTAARGQLMISSWSGYIAYTWDNPNYPVFNIVDIDLGPLSELDAFNQLSHTWKTKFYDKCAEDYSSAPWTCMFGPAAYDYITGPTSVEGNMDLPVLVFQNQQDQLYMNLSQVPADISTNTLQDTAARNAWISQMNEAMGLSSSTDTSSTKIKWLYSVSDPASEDTGTLQPNVHPPTCYLFHSPDLPWEDDSHSLDAMLRDFWHSRGKGPGRGRATGQIRTFADDFVTVATGDCENETYENH